MNVISLNLDFFYPLHRRWLVGNLLIILLLGVFFADLWLDHPFTIFLSYILPYLIYYSICFSAFHIIRLRKFGLWFLLLPLLILLFEVYDIVKWYYYNFLTAHHIVFYNPWTKGDENKLFIKIVRWFCFLIICLQLDNLYWQKKKKRKRIVELQQSLSDVADNALLSGHFLFQLSQFAVEKKIVFDLKVLDFFQYVINKIALRNARVALDEEWRYLRQLASMCVHRKIMIKGEELVPSNIWNRSVPTLSLMTWIDNAVTHSPGDLISPIVLEWTRVADGIMLTIRNRIAAPSVEKGTGKGLQLVNHLFEPLRKDRVHVAYRIEQQKYFVVELKFVN